jgi:hypothetical protein
MATPDRTVIFPWIPPTLLPCATTWSPTSPLLWARLIPPGRRGRDLPQHAGKQPPHQMADEIETEMHSEDAEKSERDIRGAIRRQAVNLVIKYHIDHTLAVVAHAVITQV